MICKIETWEPNHTRREMVVCADGSGAFVRTEDHKRVLEEILSAAGPVDTYYSTASGKMRKRESDGAPTITASWVRIEDHRAHLSALEIKWSREDETSVKGVRHPRKVEVGREIPPPIAESHRYQFNSSMGPYLHLDDHGEWIPYRVHEAIAARLRSAQTEEEKRLRKQLARVTATDTRERARQHLVNDRARADRVILAHDTRVVLDYLETLEANDEGAHSSDVNEVERALQNLTKLVRELVPGYRLEDEDNEE